MRLSLTKMNQSEGDYSGLDINNKCFTGIDFHNSVFNGAYFKNSRFVNCDLSHTEFTEAKFLNCDFENCKLDYCDFVFLTAQQTSFRDCTFSQAEWRENSFIGLRFTNCEFYNSTISLCMFSRTVFDQNSSQNFYGATKRFNVFSQSFFELLEDKVDFLSLNYGIRIADKDAVVTISPKIKSDLLLYISFLRYLHKLDSFRFVDLVSRIADALSSGKQKNNIQKIKYLTLICKLTAEEDSLSVFCLELLLIELNKSAKKVTDSALFMEMVDLIMFLKTHQYKAMKVIESEVMNLTSEFSNNIIIRCRLENTYRKAEIKKYSFQLADFVGIPRDQISLLSYETGSTFFEFIIKCSVSIGGVLMFINFSLKQVHKTIDYLAKIKKNLKYLGKKTDKSAADTEKIKPGNSANQQDLAVVPFAVMSDEGNIYHTQVTNIINIHGSALIKLDGLGEINITLKKAKAS